MKQNNTLNISNFQKQFAFSRYNYFLNFHFSLTNNTFNNSIFEDYSNFILLNPDIDIGFKINKIFELFLANNNDLDEQQFAFKKILTNFIQEKIPLNKNLFEQLSNIYNSQPLLQTKLLNIIDILQKENGLFLSFNYIQNLEDKIINNPLILKQLSMSELNSFNYNCSNILDWNNIENDFKDIYILQLLKEFKENTINFETFLNISLKYKFIDNLFYLYASQNYSQNFYKIIEEYKNIYTQNQNNIDSEKQTEIQNLYNKLIKIEDYKLFIESIPAKEIHFYNFSILNYDQKTQAKIILEKFELFWAGLFNSAKFYTNEAALLSFYFDLQQYQIFVPRECIEFNKFIEIQLFYNAAIKQINNENSIKNLINEYLLINSIKFFNFIFDTYSTENFKTKLITAVTNLNNEIYNVIEPVILETFKISFEYKASKKIDAYYDSRWTKINNFKTAIEENIKKEIDLNFISEYQGNDFLFLSMLYKNITSNTIILRQNNVYSLYNLQTKKFLNFQEQIANENIINDFLSDYDQIYYSTFNFMQNDNENITNDLITNFIIDTKNFILNNKHIDVYSKLFIKLVIFKHLIYVTNPIFKNIEQFLQISNDIKKIKILPEIMLDQANFEVFTDKIEILNNLQFILEPDIILLDKFLNFKSYFLIQHYIYENLMNEKLIVTLQNFKAKPNYTNMTNFFNIIFCRLFVELYKPEFFILKINNVKQILNESKYDGNKLADLKEAYTFAYNKIQRKSIENKLIYYPLEPKITCLQNIISNLNILAGDMLESDKFNYLLTSEKYKQIDFSNITIQEFEQIKNENKDNFKTLIQINVKNRDNKPFEKIIEGFKDYSNEITKLNSNIRDFDEQKKAIVEYYSKKTNANENRINNKIIQLENKINALEKKKNELQKQNQKLIASGYENFKFQIKFITELINSIPKQPSNKQTITILETMLDSLIKHQENYSNQTLDFFFADKLVTFLNSQLEQNTNLLSKENIKRINQEIKLIENNSGKIYNFEKEKIINYKDIKNKILSITIYKHFFKQIENINNEEDIKTYLTVNDIAFDASDIDFILKSKTEKNSFENINNFMENVKHILMNNNTLDIIKIEKLNENLIDLIQNIFNFSSKKIKINQETFESYIKLIQEGSLIINQYYNENKILEQVNNITIEPKFIKTIQYFLNSKNDIDFTNDITDITNKFTKLETQIASKPQFQILEKQNNILRKISIFFDIISNDKYNTIFTNDRDSTALAIQNNEFKTNFKEVNNKIQKFNNDLEVFVNYLSQISNNSISVSILNSFCMELKKNFNPNAVDNITTFINTNTALLEYFTQNLNSIILETKTSYFKTKFDSTELKANFEQIILLQQQTLQEINSNHSIRYQFYTEQINQINSNNSIVLKQIENINSENKKLIQDIDFLNNEMSVIEDNYKNKLNELNTVAQNTNMDNKLRIQMLENFSDTFNLYAKEFRQNLQLIQNKIDLNEYANFNIDLLNIDPIDSKNLITNIQTFCEKTKKFNQALVYKKKLESEIDALKIILEKIERDINKQHINYVDSVKYHLETLSYNYKQYYEKQNYELNKINEVIKNIDFTEEIITDKITIQKFKEDINEFKKNTNLIQKAEADFFNTLDRDQITYINNLFERNNALISQIKTNQIKILKTQYKIDADNLNLKIIEDIEKSIDLINNQIYIKLQTDYQNNLNEIEKLTNENIQLKTLNEKNNYYFEALEATKISQDKIILYLISVIQKIEKINFNFDISNTIFNFKNIIDKGELDTSEIISKSLTVIQNTFGENNFDDILVKRDSDFLNQELDLFLSKTFNFKTATVESIRNLFSKFIEYIQENTISNIVPLFLKLLKVLNNNVFIYNDNSQASKYIGQNIANSIAEKEDIIFNLTKENLEIRNALVDINRKIKTLKLPQEKQINIFSEEDIEPDINLINLVQNNNINLAILSDKIQNQTELIDKIEDYIKTNQNYLPTIVKLLDLIRQKDTNEFKNIQENYILSSDLADFFTCPIGKYIINDPVITPDGQIFDRPNIIRAIETSGVNPLTKNALRVDQLITVYPIKNYLEKIKQNDIKIDFNNFPNDYDQLIKENSNKQNFKNLATQILKEVNQKNKPFETVVQDIESQNNITFDQKELTILKLLINNINATIFNDTATIKLSDYQNNLSNDIIEKTGVSIKGVLLATNIYLNENKDLFLEFQTMNEFKFEKDLILKKQILKQFDNSRINKYILDNEFKTILNLSRIIKDINKTKLIYDFSNQDITDMFTTELSKVMKENDLIFILALAYMRPNLIIKNYNQIEFPKDIPNLDTYNYILEESKNALAADYDDKLKYFLISFKLQFLDKLKYKTVEEQDYVKMAKIEIDNLKNEPDDNTIIQNVIKKINDTFNRKFEYINFGQKVKGEKREDIIFNLIAYSLEGQNFHINFFIDYILKNKYDADIIERVFKTLIFLDHNFLVVSNNVSLNIPDINIFDQNLNTMAQYKKEIDKIEDNFDPDKYNELINKEMNNLQLNFENLEINNNLDTYITVAKTILELIQEENWLNKQNQINNLFLNLQTLEIKFIASEENKTQVENLNLNLKTSLKYIADIIKELHIQLKNEIEQNTLNELKNSEKYQEKIQFLEKIIEENSNKILDLEKNKAYVNNILKIYNEVNISFEDAKTYFKKVNDTTLENFKTNFNDKLIDIDEDIINILYDKFLKVFTKDFILEIKEIDIQKTKIEKLEKELENITQKQKKLEADKQRIITNKKNIKINLIYKPSIKDSIANYKIQISIFEIIIDILLPNSKLINNIEAILFLILSAESLHQYTFQIFEGQFILNDRQKLLNKFDQLILTQKQLEFYNQIFISATEDGKQIKLIQEQNNMQNDINILNNSQIDLIQKDKDIQKINFDIQADIKIDFNFLKNINNFENIKPNNYSGRLYKETYRQNIVLESNINNIHVKDCYKQLPKTKFMLPAPKINKNEDKQIIDINKPNLKINTIQLEDVSKINIQRKDIIQITIEENNILNLKTPSGNNELLLQTEMNSLFRDIYNEKLIQESIIDNEVNSKLFLQNFNIIKTRLNSQSEFIKQIKKTIERYENYFNENKRQENILENIIKEIETPKPINKIETQIEDKKQNQYFKIPKTKIRIKQPSQNQENKQTNLVTPVEETNINMAVYDDLQESTYKENPTKVFKGSENLQSKPDIIYFSSETYIKPNETPTLTNLDLLYNPYKNPFEKQDAVKKIRHKKPPKEYDENIMNEEPNQIKIKQRRNKLKLKAPKEDNIIFYQTNKSQKQFNFYPIIKKMENILNEDEWYQTLIDIEKINIFKIAEINPEILLARQLLDTYFNSALDNKYYKDYDAVDIKFNSIPYAKLTQVGYYNPNFEPIYFIFPLLPVFYKPKFNITQSKFIQTLIEYYKNQPTIQENIINDIEKDFSSDIYKQIPIEKLKELQDILNNNQDNIIQEEEKDNDISNILKDFNILNNRSIDNITINDIDDDINNLSISDQAYELKQQFQNRIQKYYQYINNKKKQYTQYTKYARIPARIQIDNLLFKKNIYIFHFDSFETFANNFKRLADEFYFKTVYKKEELKKISKNITVIDNLIIDQTFFDEKIVNKELNLIQQINITDINIIN